MGPMAVCAFCGEMFDDSRPNCPHCGADTELTWSNDEYDPELSPDPDAEAEYQAFLKNEGLAGDARKSGCLLLLAIPGALWAAFRSLL